MIPKTIFQHVIQTFQEIPIRPVVVLAGDEQQQQPIETIEGNISQVESMLQEPKFFRLVNHYRLTTQCRIEDEDYERFVNHIRFWTPSQPLLDAIQDGQVVSPNSVPTENEISDIVLQHPHATVLTVSRRASVIVNKAVISRIFGNRDPLAQVQCDYDMEPIYIYKGMRVLITQNRDKRNGIVNGQDGVIHSIENATIFVTLPNDKIVTIYPVTYMNNENPKVTCYPFIPSYTLTITKSQGQNLNKVIIWFDSRKVGPGSAYVALSRIRRRTDLILLTPMLENHIKPVSWNNVHNSD